MIRVVPEVEEARLEVKAGEWSGEADNTKASDVEIVSEVKVRFKIYDPASGAVVDNFEYYEKIKGVW